VSPSRRDPATGAVTYVLGHAARELERLALQARIYDGVTRRLFLRAGIGPGHRVVDLGCGAGDVTLLVGDLVGATGSVIGVDRAQEAVSTTVSRAAAAGHAQTRAVVAELDAFVPEAPVDAVVGRFVLMHQPDPVALLSRVRHWVRPGGIVAFVESDNAACQPGQHSQPHSPTYDRIVRAWQGIIHGAGAHLDMGRRLEASFVAAGLVQPHVEAETYASGDPASPIFRFAVESLRSMLPLAAAASVAVPAPHEMEQLEARLEAEVAALAGTLAAPPAYAVWARLSIDD
jgi:ubiquinone/menaquinone biosynthesis C-methylase UbiE